MKHYKCAVFVYFLLIIFPLWSMYSKCFQW